MPVPTLCVHVGVGVGDSDGHSTANTLTVYQEDAQQERLPGLPQASHQMRSRWVLPLPSLAHTPSLTQARRLTHSKARMLEMYARGVRVRVPSQEDV